MHGCNAWNRQSISRRARVCEGGEGGAEKCGRNGRNQVQAKNTGLVHHEGEHQAAQQQRSGPTAEQQAAAAARAVRRADGEEHPKSRHRGRRGMRPHGGGCDVRGERVAEVSKLGARPLDRLRARITVQKRHRPHHRRSGPLLAHFVVWGCLGPTRLL